MNTRTILIWHNNGEQQLTFTVNPKTLRVSRPNTNRVYALAMGGEVNVWGGRGLREVKFATFLPGENSPFFDGVTPDAALAMLKAWQDSGDPVRLIISDTDINDAFLIEDVSETLREGDGDTAVTVSLREYKFPNEIAPERAETGAETKPTRVDERVEPDTWTVKRGDTLWDIACNLYGDGTRWREIAAKNGITNPRTLQIGRVLVL